MTRTPSVLEKTLRQIAENDPDCHCDNHADPDCCNQARVFCAHCIAEAALEQATAAAHATPTPDARVIPEALIRQIEQKWRDYRTQTPRSFQVVPLDIQTVQRENVLMDAFLRDLSALLAAVRSPQEHEQEQEKWRHAAIDRGAVLRAATAFVADDAAAAAYQTLGQYRSALLELLRTDPNAGD